MLHEEVERFSRLSGEDGWHTSGARLGGYLDGYDRAMKDAIPIDWLMQKINEWKSDGGYACDFGARLLTALINDWKRKKNGT